jgi:putative cell wall-binding protein
MATSVVTTMVAGGAVSATAAPVDGVPNSSLGYPTFQGSDTPIPDSGVPFDPASSYLGSVFASDLAAGAGQSTEKDFWVDSLLARYGSDPAGSGQTGSGAAFTYDSDRNQYLFSRGRAAFLRTHDPKVLGFGGDLAYWDSINGKGGYDVTLKVAGQALTLTEDEVQRKQTPSYWRSVFTTSQAGLDVVQTKYITDANVLVTQIELRSTSAVDVDVEAASPLVSTVDGDELTGTFSAHNDVTTVRARFSGNDMAPQGSVLAGSVSVSAGTPAVTKLQLGLTASEIATSTSEYEAIKSGDRRDPGAAFTSHVTSYNQWWADNIPFIETPEKNIDKTFFYRWWLSRFNFLDANMPGNTLQFPTTIEGVLGYDNAIDLTIGMHIDDLKWLRDPSYAYGSWLSAGETAGSQGQYRDNPADPSNWNASHTQYITKAAWESFQIHGGPAPVAGLIGQYGESDTEGQLAVWDSNGDHLLDTNWNAWTGNDADAVSFAEHPGSRMNRAESAYVYAGAVAAAAAYRAAGDEDSAAALDGEADKVKSAVLENLWDSDDKLVKHQFVNGPGAGDFAKWKEVNNYYPYSMGLMPAAGDSDYTDDYESALNLFADADQYPVFPFFTANQADKAESGVGTNNFSVINSTVIFRIYQAALRQYHAEESGAVTPEQFKQLLYWNAFAHYQGGDNRYPDQNEFWADGSAADGGSVEYRSWIHHTQLGSTNWTMIEDVAGLRPREDDRIELDPIALPGWGHFTVNNLSYHGQDLTVVWNGDGSYDANGAPAGYSLFLGGELAFTVDRLTHVIYDPATGTAEIQDDSSGEVVTAVTGNLPTATEVDYPADSRVIELFAKAGRQVDPAAHGAGDLAEGSAIEASSQASGDTRAAAAAVNGSTVSDGFWAPQAGDTSPSLTVDLGSPKSVDDFRVFFYQTTTSSTVQGFAEPSLYQLEYLDGETWKPVPSQARTPAAPAANLNKVQFPSVTAQKFRASFTPQPGQSIGVKEIQLFDTGIAAPASVNAAPVVVASIGATRGGAVGLTGIVKDDGLPAAALTSEWTTVSAPEGGDAQFDDASSRDTTVRFTAAGTYVLALTASDGDLETSDRITVQGEMGDGTFNAALDASSLTASYTASWNSIEAVRDGEINFSGGDNSTLWGTWSGDRPAQQWLQYDWPAEIPVQSASVGFWYDNATQGAGDNVAVPKAWKLQYWNAAAKEGVGDWADVPLADGAVHGTDRDTMNEVAFSGQVVTSKLRATFDADTNGSTFAGIGVTEFEVNAPDPVVVDPVDVATTTGTQPQLPETTSVVYSDGSRRSLPVTWDEIPAGQVDQEREFVVTGRVLASSTPVTATIWVRSELNPESLTLNGTVPVVQALKVGVTLQLPGTVTGIYNNGVNRSGLAVEWDPAELEDVDTAVAGTYTVSGVATDDLAPGRTAEAIATITVGGEQPTVDFSALQELIDANRDREKGASTDESWQAFVDALTAAEAELTDPAATQQSVDEAREALQAAIDGLTDGSTAPVVDRVGGADRFEVSASASQLGFPDGAATVYVASGTKFPDALSAAPAATVDSAPVLLALPDRVPEVVMTELKRLDPQRIVIVGGLSTISREAEKQLSDVADVSRIGGADRFEASRNVATAAFPDGALVAVLATGRSFPDALSAGAAVGGGGPVILVDGESGGLDAATTALLTDLGVEEIVIAGGPASVSSAIEADAAELAETTRLGGVDRYAASRAINDYFFDTADRVMLATGSKFPDALSGSAVAPALEAPLFTVRTECIPPETLAEITALGATKVTLLGGPNTLTAEVESLTACSAG